MLYNILPLVLPLVILASSNCRPLWYQVPIYIDSKLSVRCDSINSDCLPYASVDQALENCIEVANSEQCINSESSLACIIGMTTGHPSFVCDDEDGTEVPCYEHVVADVPQYMCTNSYELTDDDSEDYIDQVGIPSVDAFGPMFVDCSASYTLCENRCNMEACLDLVESCSQEVDQVGCFDHHADQVGDCDVVCAQVAEGVPFVVNCADGSLVDLYSVIEPKVTTEGPEEGTDEEETEEPVETEEEEPVVETEEEEPVVETEEEPIEESEEEDVEEEAATDDEDATDVILPVAAAGVGLVIVGSAVGIWYFKEKPYLRPETPRMNYSSDDPDVFGDPFRDSGIPSVDTHTDSFSSWMRSGASPTAGTGGPPAPIEAPSGAAPRGVPGTPGTSQLSIEGDVFNISTARFSFEGHVFDSQYH